MVVAGGHNITCCRCHTSNGLRIGMLCSYLQCALPAAALMTKRPAHSQGSSKSTHGARSDFAGLSDWLELLLVTISVAQIAASPVHVPRIPYINVLLSYRWPWLISAAAR